MRLFVLEIEKQLRFEYFPNLTVVGHESRRPTVFNKEFKGKDIANPGEG